MVGWLKTWVYNIAVFIIFISIIELIMPNQKYKKYIKLILGLIFILVIIEPFFSIMGLDNYLTMSTMNSNLLIQQENVKTGLDHYNDKQKAIVREQYEMMVLDQIEIVLNSNNIKLFKGKIEFYEDDEQYGEIKNMELTIGESSVEAGEDEQIVEPILIDSVDINGSKEPTQHQDILLENKVKGILVDYYKINKDTIKIHIYETKKVGD
ncbi:stage III sporulation protein AF [Vallitalea okinawensis]|uniref:stage III sporulation protein AF n=1 Tax=Vallitalea okinawensis TaxID=2078660 RepID=UPI000CFCB375|nr:stage III sporulation protein AF [Vallitalea okinawensis]